MSHSLINIKIFKFFIEFSWEFSRWNKFKHNIISAAYAWVPYFRTRIEYMNRDILYSCERAVRKKPLPQCPPLAAKTVFPYSCTIDYETVCTSVDFETLLLWHNIDRKVSRGLHVRFRYKLAIFSGKRKEYWDTASSFFVPWARHIARFFLPWLREFMWKCWVNDRFNDI